MKELEQKVDSTQNPSEKLAWTRYKVERFATAAANPKGEELYNYDIQRVETSGAAVRDAFRDSLEQDELALPGSVFTSPGRPPIYPLE